MKLSLGFSPCPNDTFIFDALVNAKIDTGGIEFDVFLEDVQTLNEWAIEGKLDISKISYGVLPLIMKEYYLLKSGGALGRGVGPLLISKNELSSNETTQREIIESSAIAIPGVNTTAHLLFSNAYPNALNKVFMRFDEIENWVLAGNGLGVIIHENRFTYQEKGLYKIIDLGTAWEETTGSPIPLGGIVAKRKIDQQALWKIDALIKKSIQSAFDHYPILPDYVRSHSQEMDEKVMRQHIELYVNAFSLDPGETGRKAIQTLFSHTNPTPADTDFFLREK